MINHDEEGDDDLDNLPPEEYKRRLMNYRSRWEYSPGLESPEEHLQSDCREPD